jgi:hypothetical protein
MEVHDDRRKENFQRIFFGILKENKTHIFFLQCSYHGSTDEACINLMQHQMA